MKKSNNIISEWLDKYGDPDIAKQVEKEADDMRTHSASNAIKERKGK